MVRMPGQAGGGASVREVLRLRLCPYKTGAQSSLRMTSFRFFLCTLLLFVFVSAGWGATYYVSSSQGSDTNAGTSVGAPWQTLAHVNAQTFNPGDSILFKRGDVWNDSLTPPSSGTSGNPITFDAYGTGAAPNFTGYSAIAPSSWQIVTGNVWKALLPSTFTSVNFCLFGSIWGQKVPAVSSNLTAQWDFYLANGYLYVYSVGNPEIFYGGEPIVPMALSNVPVININSQSWLRFQHILVNWFDDYGVYVQGTSDHLVFANMEADSMIPEGTQPLGLYVDESAPGPGDIKIYNFSAHLNYDGFRFDGAATAVTMVNDNAYANRDGALVDNTGAVTYSYCHFYASSLAVAGSTDVEFTSGTGPTAGAGNIAADTPAAVQVWQRYPARVTLTVDDEGMTAGADTYYAGTVLPVADAAGVPVGAAITVGYPLAQTLISEFQSWIDAGRDVTAHSISHTYYTNTDALDIQYTGAGTAASLSISGKVLTITVTGASDSVSYNLGLTGGQTVGTGLQTMVGLETALNNTGKFTASLSPLPCQGPYGTGCSLYTGNALLSQDLADVSGADVKTSVYHTQLDVTRLTTDEITLSRQWMTTNLTGLPATPVYVYPGGYENPNMEAITAGVPYVGARGALHEGGTANTGLPIAGAKDTYASGINVEDITSFGVNPSWQGLFGVTPALLNQKIQALVWKEEVWGVPWGIFWHNQELVQNDPVGGTEITNLIQDFKNAGATVLKNTDLVNWITSGTQAAGVLPVDGNYYYKSAAANAYGATGGIDFRPTASSPVVDTGANLGVAYEIDLNGINQNSYGSGWEIGAHTYIPQSTYGEGTGPGTAYFSIGSGASSTSGPAPGYQAYVGTGIVEWPGTVPNVGGVLKNGSVVYDTSYLWGELNRVVRCTDQAIDPNPAYGNQSKSAGLGGSGDAVQMFNANSTLMGFNLSGGKHYITVFNPATMACGDPVTGYAITSDKNLTNPGSSSVAYNFGGGSFDWLNPNVYYAMGSGSDAPLNGLAKYSFNSSNQFTVIPTLLDFGCCGLPIGSLAPAWSAAHAYANGDYISYTLSEPDWTASNAYSTLGTIIVPLTNNPLGCAFKLVTAGTSGSSEPTWSTTGSCLPASNGVKTDGSAGWRNLGAGAVFVYQLTSSGGTSGGAAPTFGPNFLSTASDNGLTWTNVGVDTPPAWQSFAGISQDGTRFCSAFSNNAYGDSGNYNNYNGDQGTGIYAACYSSTLNQFFLLNTATGIVSTVTCLGGTGYNCAGGTQSKITALGTTFVGTGNCAYVIHNEKGSVGQDYNIVARQTLLGSGGSCGGAEAVWSPFAAFNATTSLQAGSFNLNHWAMMNSHVINLGQNSGINGGFTGGAYTQLIPLANPAATPFVTWEVGAPYTNPCDTSWVPNDPDPPCNYPLVYDSHMGSAYNPGGMDSSPVCGSVYNIATLAPPAVAPDQGEEVCISTSPSWNYGSAIGAYQVWRFTHSFNTGANAFFDVQFAISQMSGDGRFLAFSSDWDCTLGNTSGTMSPVNCGAPWVPGAAYAAGQMVNPFSSTGGSGTNYGVYQVTTGGTAASTAPAWFVCNSGTAGNTVTDANGVVYTCLGTSNGKGEVFVVELARQQNSGPVVSAANFGMQCGLGQLSNCEGSGSTPIAWPQTQAQPGFLRLHDAGTYWAILNPASATYSWTNLDNWLDMIAQEEPVAVSQVFTWVPCWDAPACSAPPTAPTGTNAPPNDLVASGSPTFNAFVTAFVNHCSPHGNCVKNLIKYYEMWNEWDLTFHWTGTMAQIYEMVAPAAAIIRANVPGAVILMPSTTPESATYQTDFQNWLNYETANGRISDWVNWHVYLTNTNTTTFTPEQQWINYNQNFLNIQRATPGWTTAPWADTETNFNGSPELEYTCPIAEYTAQDCAGQVVRWQILHDSNGAAGLFWYYWNTTIGGNSTNETAYYWMMQYLVGGRFSSAATYTTTAGVQTWIAPFVEANGTAALWVWSPSEAGTNFVVPAGYGDYRDLGGGTTTVSAGQSVAIGVQPILLEQ